MTVDRLPGQVREFANYLDGLLARLDQGSGWCAVFWQRDPDGMRACLDGHEMPPWDVVEALLQDLAAAYGTAVAAQEAERARPLHIAALVAHDTQPGARDALGDRLDVMLREQRYAVERQAELGRRLAAATTREEAEALRLDLAWAHDDHERATARCAELRYRIAELDRRAVGGPVRRIPGARREGAGVGPGHQASVYAEAGGPAEGIHVARHQEIARPAPADATAPALSSAVYDAVAPAPSSAVYDAVAPALSSAAYDAMAPAASSAAAEVAAPAKAPAPSSAPKQRKRRRGSARFAGIAEEEAAPVVVPPAAEAVLPAPTPVAAPRRTPRGARFAGAAAEPERRPAPPAEPLFDAAARRESAEAVTRLVALRAEGRSGEAHALLAELAHWPAARIPVLAADLQRAGLTADWTTLLWEAASLPADRLVAAADALAEAGRTADGEQILRQGVARPAEEIGEAVRGLVTRDRHREARALLDAYVRVRTPEEAARSAAPDPQTLVPLLLEAARAVSPERHWDLIHALRVAGFTA